MVDVMPICLGILELNNRYVEDAVYVVCVIFFVNRYDRYSRMKRCCASSRQIHDGERFYILTCEV
jgi:hypothetical protein